MTQQTHTGPARSDLHRLNAVRCKRGRALFRACRGRIVRVEEYDYRVPSQHHGGLYNVCLKPGAEDCTCPDFDRYGRHTDVQAGEFYCKHLFAALMASIKSTRVAAATDISSRKEAA